MDNRVYAGLDGARGGWVLALWRPERDLCLRRLASLEELFTLPEAPAMACIDMPIGLEDSARPGGRSCDRAARQQLSTWGGQPSAIFSPPARAALAAPTFDAALALNRASGPDAPGLSLQAFNLFPLLRDVDAAMTPARQEALREAHPELAFARLAGGQAPPRKKTAAGQSARRALLSEGGLPVDALVDLRPAHLKAAWNDVLDACVLAWVASEIAAGRAQTCPQAPETDSRGLRMEIWY